ncbi:Exonuclease DPD1, chloroplastic/mitochondrial [Quillaja saponaria]|uniref:Exonuclease DPD1, chloroplastic/mitochondrial n=1 Tax=Quillaja saponaria TaxID=32244 RepID=A0AAD7VF20_QUISA|nr:Exonuclease DPD1, chloroplastic/mitochondrial [Quillaja saponaria]
MFYSFLQVPRCRFNTLADFSRFRLLGSRIYGLEGGHSRKSTGKPFIAKTEGRNRTTQNSKLSKIKREIFAEPSLTSAAVNVNTTGISQPYKAEYCDIQQMIAENEDLANLVTVIVFDIETTGFSRVSDRIIEIGFRDLQGGENSTFQTLVNPERYIPNSHVHGITTQMVKRPGVPRMGELIPILLQYVKSRQQPEGIVLLVAHNARTFDVPFLYHEFSRYSTEFPPNWLFVDTLPLAREVKKSRGLKLSSISLTALGDFYNIVNNSAHRAMADVDALSLILPKLTFDLKLPISGLVKESFRGSDAINSKKKTR